MKWRWQRNSIFLEGPSMREKRCHSGINKTADGITHIGTCVSMLLLSNASTKFEHYQWTYFKSSREKKIYIIIFRILMPWHKLMSAFTLNIRVASTFTLRNGAVNSDIRVNTLSTTWCVQHFCLSNLKFFESAQKKTHTHTHSERVLSIFAQILMLKGCVAFFHFFSRAHGDWLLECFEEMCLCAILFKLSQITPLHYLSDSSAGRN